MSVNLTYLINPKFHFPLNQYTTNCQGNYPAPSITNYPHPLFYDASTAHYLKYNPCDLNENAQGHFTVADLDIAQISVNEACFNLQTQKWQFDITSPIEVISIWGLCERPEEYTFIDNIDDIPDWYLCPPPPPQIPLSPFIDDLVLRYLFNVQGLQYYPEDLIREEEMIHFSQYVRTLNSDKWQVKFSKMLNERIIYSCADFQGLGEVENTIYEKVIKQFRDDIWYEMLSKSNELEAEAKRLMEPFLEAWIDLANREIENRCN
jgi:hypothetical protein